MSGSETFARLAAMVDERSAVWSYGGRPKGLCDLLRPRRHCRWRDAARRHFAVVHANIAAGELGLRAPNGARIGLDPDATLDHVPGVPQGTSLREWVAATETALLAMADGSRRNRAEREESSRIRRQARAINAGAPGEDCFRKRTGHRDDDDDEDEDDLVAGPTSEFSTTPVADPPSGDNRLRWTLESAGEVELDVLDLSGRRVRHLARGVFAPGTHEMTWDGRDDGGRPLRPGAYFVAGRVGELRVGQRLILLR